ncbi:hypothetical protein CVU75_00025 [Candidatus Dependentiae bacterium HGW-Dependentiae-1]|nr:MAG: hypothetical protein CVU75_00025 [Candidatus Dependentiae bacterium HGW-Dependentiae-1]
MTIHNLLRSFTIGITWNALLFVFYKIAATVLTFILFYTLTSSDFSTWANANSLIFLLLLWIDFGLRKSIPRYAPIFAQNNTSYRSFIAGLALFQLILLACALPLFIFSAQQLAYLFQLPIQGSLLHLVALIFFTEGCVALMRLIFHAHFWIKQFNSLAMIIMAIEFITNVVLITVLRLPSPQLLHGIFITKSIASIVLIICGAWRFKHLYTATIFETQQKFRMRTMIPEFIAHSLILGTYTNIKSLSERNFLLPFFTFTLGPVAANAFKLANDSALLFYRAILKTIGTADTALLAHAQLLPEKKAALAAAFKKLLRQIIWLCVPLFILIALLFSIKNKLFLQASTTTAFFIMVIGYLFEALLSPYERLLEVNRKYVTIALAYIPYCATLLYVFTHTHDLRLLPMLILFQTTRLTGSVILTVVTKKLYSV